MNGALSAAGSAEATAQHTLAEASQEVELWKSLVTAQMRETPQLQALQAANDRRLQDLDDEVEAAQLDVERRAAEEAELGRELASVDAAIEALRGRLRAGNTTRSTTVHVSLH